jgi:predicted nucleotidyltransferase
MSKREWVAKNRAAIMAAANRHGAERIRLFGSVAKGEEQADSDIDFIVKMVPGRGAFDLIDLHDDLEEMLGCKVDLITEHRWMRERVRHEIEAAAVAP